VQHAAEELRVADLLKRRADGLSSGQRQRVNLARAIVHDPAVLVLDEPTTALDVASQRFVLDAVDKARARGRAVLFSSHLMGEVEELADRVVLIDKGQPRQAGTLDEIRAAAGPGGLSSLFAQDL
jgi:sodium transport system ATP-binding protein